MTIRVTDTGIGILAEDLPKMFEISVRGGDALTRTETGTGLGLPQVKRLVELNGGSIDIASELGKGTSVTVQFPI